jgi:hypothetical protein
MLSEGFISAIQGPPRSTNSSIAKDVGIYMHELHPASTIKSSFKKSSTPVNALAVNSSHIFAAQAGKAVVHVYSIERGNQEALISFPERIHSLTFIGDGILALGTAEGRIILWEVCISLLKISIANLLEGIYWQAGLHPSWTPSVNLVPRSDSVSSDKRVCRLKYPCVVYSSPSIYIFE